MTFGFCHNRSLGNFSNFYYYILSAIFAIEKIVWIDSYFDNKNLDSKTSWKIAQKLLPSATMLVSMTFLRFYLWIPLFYGSLFYFYFYYFLQFNISDSVGNAMGIIIIFLLFFIPIYFYYLRIKLRFLWFVFLDLYGQEGVLATEVFQEMKKLNQIRKSDMFKKTLIINLGSDAIGIIVQQVIENLQKGLQFFRSWQSGFRFVYEKFCGGNK